MDSKWGGVRAQDRGVQPEEGGVQPVDCTEFIVGYVFILLATIISGELNHIHTFFHIRTYAATFSSLFSAFVMVTSEVLLAAWVFSR